MSLPGSSYLAAPVLVAGGDVALGQVAALGAGVQVEAQAREDLHQFGAQRTDVVQAPPGPRAQDARPARPRSWSPRLRTPVPAQPPVYIRDSAWATQTGFSAPSVSNV